METGSMRLVALDGDALAEILADWQRQRPGLGLMALLPEAEKQNIPRLQSACRGLGIPLAGAVFPALVSSGNFVTEGALLLGAAPAMPSFLVPDLGADGSASAAAICAAVRQALDAGAAGPGRPTLYMIFDGLIPNIASTLDALYLQLADRVSYAGVNAGSETFQPMPCLFDGERVIGGGVLCSLLPAGVGTVLKHGYPAPDRVMSATSTEGNRILQIDWQPAFHVYQDIIRAEYGIELTRENFYEYAVHFPFGIQRANTELVVRIPVALADDGSLFCVGEVPENSLLVLLQAPEAGAGNCLEGLARELEVANGPLQGRDLLAFYCAGRRMHLGESAGDELDRLQSLTGAGRMAGALSLGEIGSTHEWGYPMFHNATLVCTPWGRT